MASGSGRLDLRALYGEGVQGHGALHVVHKLVWSCPRSWFRTYAGFGLKGFG